MSNFMQAYATHLRSLFEDDDAFLNYLSLPLEEKITTMAMAYTTTQNGFPRLRWVVLLALQSLTLSRLQDEGITVSLTQEQHDLLKTHAFQDIWRTIELRGHQPDKYDKEAWIGRVGEDPVHVATMCWNDGSKEYFAHNFIEENLTAIGFEDRQHFNKVVLDTVLNKEERWSWINVTPDSPKGAFILTDPRPVKQARADLKPGSKDHVTAFIEKSLNKNMVFFDFDLKPEWEDEQGLLWVGRRDASGEKPVRHRIGTIVLDQEQGAYKLTSLDEKVIQELGFQSNEAFLQTIHFEVLVPVAQKTIWGGEPAPGYTFEGHFVVSPSALSQSNRVALHDPSIPEKVTETAREIQSAEGGLAINLPLNLGDTQILYYEVREDRTLWVEHVGYTELTRVGNVFLGGDPKNKDKRIFTLQDAIPDAIRKTLKFKDVPTFEWVMKGPLRDEDFIDCFETIERAKGICTVPRPRFTEVDGTQWI